MGLPRTPALAVDCVVRDQDGRVLLVRRKNEPFASSFALPGGFVEIGETVEAACRREVREETGIGIGELRLVGVYSDPDRDPRGHTVSIAFLGILPRTLPPRAGSDAEAAQWVDDWRSLKLAFDHAQILDDAEKMLGRVGQA
jgi:8-oxo-dGTP diphosphatase